MCPLHEVNIIMDALNLRIISTHDTQENWDKLTEFIPKAGELIVYDSDKDVAYERFKIGDGKTLLKDIPFAVDSVIMSLFKIQDNTIVADAGRVTKYKQENLIT